MPRQNPTGERYIRLRADGRYEVRLSIDGRQRSLFAATLEEARDARDKLRAARKGALPVPSERLRLGDYLDDWLAGHRPELKPGTAKRYDELLRLHVPDTLRRTPLVRVSPAQLRGLFAQKLADGLAPATVRQLRAVLREALGAAEHDGLVVRNVATLVKGPRVERPDPTVVTADHARAVLAAAAGERLEALYVLALTTAMREGELLALRWKDVDLTAGELRVRGTLKRFDRQWRLDSPKTARSRRPVLLCPEAVDALRQHKARQAEERLAATAWGWPELVFTTPRGEPWHVTSLLRLQFYPLLARAGVPRVRFHDLRHGAATLLLSLGYPPNVVSELLGHSQIGITLGTYGHVTPAQHRAAVNDLGRLLMQTP